MAYNTIMKKPKYFKGSKNKKKEVKDPVVDKDVLKHHSSKSISPKNSRSIPERHDNVPSRRIKILKKIQNIKGISLLLQGWNITAIVLLFLLGMALNTSLNTLKQESAKRQQLVAKLHTWELVSDTYPGYRDAYIQLATLAYELGDKNQALSYIEKAQQLDPNSDVVVQLEESISKMGK